MNRIERKKNHFYSKGETTDWQIRIQNSSQLRGRLIRLRATKKLSKFSIQRKKMKKKYTHKIKLQHLTYLLFFW